MLFRAAHPARWLLPAMLFAALPNTVFAQSEPEGPAPAQPAPLQSESVRVLVVRPGDTLTRLLAGAGVEAGQAKPAINALAPIFPPRSLQPGHEITVRQDPSRDDALLALILEPQPGRTVTVTRNGTGWQAVEEEAARHRHLVLARGEVSGSIFQDLSQAGLPQPLALGLVRMLGHAVDFQRELQPGDEFTVLFERFRDAEGGLLRDGEVLHAEFRLANRQLSLWRQETPNGAEWFDETGRSLRRNFLRTPSTAPGSPPALASGVTRCWASPACTRGSISPPRPARRSSPRRTAWSPASASPAVMAG
ncbi:hypothetical protein ACFQY5_12005 [Paeniroseomonas aquatica]|uniref:hypothetical protein n=1 Tax=Paeniroseomonas aquatica TaxID=373043 RepID=UPI00360F6E66